MQHANSVIHCDMTIIITNNYSLAYCGHVYGSGLGSGGGIVHEGGVDVAEPTEQLLGGGADRNPWGIYNTAGNKTSMQVIHESRMKSTEEGGR